MSFHVFLSTPSARRATCALCSDSMAGGYFYPRPPRGGRLMRMYILSSSSVFLSTPSARRATYILSDVGCIGLDFYPRPPRGGRQATRAHTRMRVYFYPRPPRGGRLQNIMLRAGQIWISIHALREEGDQHGSSKRHAVQRFLSTPSARRATYHDLARVVQRPISIHALREEGDYPCCHSLSW